MICEKRARGIMFLRFNLGVITNMKTIKLLIGMLLAAVLLVPLLAGCSSGPVTEQQIIAVAQREDLAIVVRADGNIEMPEALNLYFDTTMFTPPYSARISKMYVQKGDLVHAGALLAKLDDTGQKLSVQNAQYALELAINNVVQTSCCGGGRYPTFYADAVALLRYENAAKEMQKAGDFLFSGDYASAAEQIALAKYDVDATRNYYASPDYKNLRLEYNDLDMAVETSDDLITALARLASETDFIAGLQVKIKGGQYDDAQRNIQVLLGQMTDTHSVVKRITHLPGNVSYPDMPTTYTVVNELDNSLAVLKELANSKDFDAVQFAERLSLARHDLAMGKQILEENISVNRLGVNLKVLRDYNIGIQTAVINLQRAKQALLKTELIAPFDGRVVDVNLQAGDMITQRYAVTGAPIDSYVLRLVNTGKVRMAGVVDEIDVAGIKEGEPADVYVDALPGRVIKGKVTFISPYGPLQTRSIPSFGSLQSTLATYRVEVSLDPKDAAFLAAGQTAGAVILSDMHSGVVTVPNSALAGKEGEYSVRVLVDEKANLIEQRPVKTGLQSSSRTEIVSGLKEGEKVVLQKITSPARSVKK
jgi:RND family efflux transporter MFP subunit